MYIWCHSVLYLTSMHKFSYKLFYSLSYVSAFTHSTPTHQQHRLQNFPWYFHHFSFHFFAFICLTHTYAFMLLFVDTYVSRQHWGNQGRSRRSRWVAAAAKLNSCDIIYEAKQVFAWLGLTWPYRQNATSSRQNRRIMRKRKETQVKRVEGTEAELRVCVVVTWQ